MKRLLLSMVVVSSLTCGAVGSAVAENQEETDASAVVLDEMVVTASRSEEALSSVPASVSVVSQEDIANSTAKDVADLLRTEAGVYVKDITGGRRNYTVDLRGFGETAALNTLVLVDGRRVNQADLSGTDWTQIPLDRVERIEIIRGGRASVFYGDNAAGGVVNIITRKAGEDHGGLAVQVGSYDTYKVSAYKSGTVDSFSYFLSGSYLNTDGYRDNSDSEAKDFGADAAYAVSEKVELNVSGGYHEDLSQMPGAITESEFAAGVSRTDTTSPDDFADTRDYYLKVVPEIGISDNGRLMLATSYRKRDATSYYSYDAGYYNADTGIETLEVNPQLVLDQTVFGFLHSLNMGADYSRAKQAILNTSEYFGGLSIGDFDLEKENFGYYIHDDLTVTPDFTVSGGYRYDKARYGFKSATGEVNPDSTDFDESLYTVGINYKLNAASNFYMSFSRSYRYPVLDEIFSYYTNSLDPLIGPQTSNNYEAGFRYTFDNGVSMGLNLFYIKTRDEIYYDPGTYANANMDGDTIRQGAELTAAGNFPWGQLNVNYTFTDAEIDGGAYDGTTFPDVPKQQAGFNLLVDYWKPFSVVLDGKYVGDRYFISDWTNGFGKQDDYFVMNAKLKYVWDAVTLFLDINNLLDTEYEEYVVLSSSAERSYYPSPKINFLAGVSYDF